MKIKCAQPYLTLHGVVKGINPDDPDMRFYFRTNKQTGEVTACKCPTYTKPPTQAQITARHHFGEIYGKGRRIKRNAPKQQTTNTKT